MGLFDCENCFFVEASKVEEVMEYIKDSLKYTFDLKKNIDSKRGYSRKHS